MTYGGSLSITVLCCIALHCVALHREEEASKGEASELRYHHLDFNNYNFLFRLWNTFFRERKWNRIPITLSNFPI